MKFKKLAGYTLISLGVMHLFAQLFGPKSEADLLIIEQMKTHSIFFIGEHTLWGFYVAFSISMGLLFIFSGSLIITSTSKYALLSSVFFLISLTVVAVIYVHALAYGMMICALLFTIIAIRKKEYA